jgi:hypothetical protein
MNHPTRKDCPKSPADRNETFCLTGLLHTGIGECQPPWRVAGSGWASCGGFC